MTAEEVQKAFTAELQELLDTWGAELRADDHYPGWPECGEDIRVEITIPAIYDGNGRTEREWCCFDVGRYMSAKK
jgi:hypothetical protein